MPSFQVKNEEIREVGSSKFEVTGPTERGENNPNEFCLALKCALLAAVLEAFLLKRVRSG